MWTVNWPPRRSLLWVRNVWRRQNTASATHRTRGCWGWRRRVGTQTQSTSRCTRWPRPEHRPTPETALFTHIFTHIFSSSSKSYNDSCDMQQCSVFNSGIAVSLTMMTWFASCVRRSQMLMGFIPGSFPSPSLSTLSSLHILPLPSRPPLHPSHYSYFLSLFPYSSPSFLPLSSQQ